MPNSYSRRSRSNNSTFALLSKPPLAPAPQVEGRLVTPGGVGQLSPAQGGHHSIAKPGADAVRSAAPGREAGHLAWGLFRGGIADAADAAEAVLAEMRRPGRAGVLAALAARLVLPPHWGGHLVADAYDRRVPPEVLAF